MKSKTENGAADSAWWRVRQRCYPRFVRYMWGTFRIHVTDAGCDVYMELKGPAYHADRNSRRRWQVLLDRGDHTDVMYKLVLDTDNLKKAFRKMKALREEISCLSALA